MKTVKLVVLFAVAFCLGMLANAYIPSANAQAGGSAEKIFQYKLEQCGGLSPKASENCLNSMGREGWRAVSMMGGGFVIFEK